jgi:hypothetical protein
MPFTWDSNKTWSCIQRGGVLVFRWGGFGQRRIASRVAAAAIRGVAREGGASVNFEDIGERFITAAAATSLIRRTCSFISSKSVIVKVKKVALVAVLADSVLSEKVFAQFLRVCFRAFTNFALSILIVSTDTESATILSGVFVVALV